MGGIRGSLLAAVLTATVIPAAWAETRSTVTGTVTDSSGAVLPGVTMKLESPNMVGGVLQATTNERGVYRFVDLPPGTYEITAAVNGFQTVKRTGLRLLFGTTLTVDIPLVVGGANETVTVEGRSPTVDVTTAQSALQVDSDLIQTIPTVANPRDGLNLMELSPGINNRTAFGGALSANEVLFDGTPTTLPERQGTNAAVINPNWVEQIQVVSLGASAEYGEFSGTVGNFVAKSGSDNFQGLVEYRKVPGSWIADNLGALPPVLQTRFTPAELLRQWDTTGQIGGPIVRDRLFFFAGFQYVRSETQGAGVPAPDSQKQWRALGKVNWSASPKLKLDGTVQTSKATRDAGASTTTTADVTSLSTEPNTVWTGRASWAPSPKTLLEIRTGGLRNKQVSEPKNGGRNGPSSRLDVATGIRSANANSYRTLEQSRVSLGGSLTRLVDNVFGRHHDLKVGAEFRHMRFYQESGFPSGMSFQDRNGVPEQVTLWNGDVFRASGNQTILYAQDGWKVADRITLEPGLRVTFNRGRTPTAGDVFSTTPISLRFGAAWDVTSDHKTVVRAHYGRYHEAFGSIEYEFTDTEGQTDQVTARVLTDGRFQELTRFTPAGNQFVDPDVRQAYLDQYLLGIERELFTDFSINAQYVHREYKALFNWIDTGSIYAPVQMRDPGPDGRVGTADDGSLLTLYNLTNPGRERRVFSNPDGGWRRYRALQLVLQKRFSRNWQLLAGYTRSKAEGSVNNYQADNYGGLTPAANPFINPNNAINAAGRNICDFPHELVVRGSYHLDLLGGFNVGGVYRYISGLALSRTAVFRLAQGNTTVRVEPRGSLPTPSTSQADVRFDKTFPLGSKARTLSLYIDIFNVNNQGIAAGYTEASGASFGVPAGGFLTAAAWSAPRTFLISARLSF